MIKINWDPIGHLWPIPINWYGLTFAIGFLIATWLVWRWAPRFSVPRAKLEGLLLWILIGVVVGARLYYIVQNNPGDYLREPWRIAAVWEGGLAYFGGLFGGISAAYLYTRREGLRFSRFADLFAAAIPVGSAIGRISCGLAGMDYGTPTQLPWGVIYTNPNSYAPTDGIARHPDQYYELLGDLIIAGILIKLRGKLPDSGLFLLYLILFSILRFFIFFVRGSVNPVALGLKNAQWTAIAILSVAAPLLIAAVSRNKREAHARITAGKEFEPVGGDMSTKMGAAVTSKVDTSRTAIKNSTAG
jgi:phosphatidylglycerol:prolipoprotein diacylglycerol transferase